MAEKKGYIEDRRPASDMDPYVVTAIIADTTLLDESQSQGLVDAYRKWKSWLAVTTIEE
jgi:glutamine synthetase